MDIVYVLLLLASFLGTASGVVLAFFTAEELIPGRIYFVGLRAALLLISAALFAYVSSPALIALAAFLVVLSAIVKSAREASVFAFLGILFYASSSTELFPAVSSLIFMYGMVSGTLLAAGFADKKPEINRELVKRFARDYIPYVLVGLVFLAI